MTRKNVTRRIVFISCLLIAAVSLSAPSAQAITYDIQQDLNLYGDLNQNTIPDIGSVACAPTAAVNSFVYLQNSFPSIYDHYLVPDLHGTPDTYEDDELISVAEILASNSYMDTSIASGGSNQAAYGTWKYIEDHAPGSTIYATQSYVTWVGPVPEPSWHDNVPPTWSFLYDELVASAGVQIAVGYPDLSWAHQLTLTSFYWDDIDEDGIIDFAEDAWIGYINPSTGAWGSSDIWYECVAGVGCGIATDYRGLTNVAFLGYAMSERAVPEPSTALLLGIGLAGLAAAGRRRSLH